VNYLTYLTHFLKASFPSVAVEPSYGKCKVKTALIKRKAAKMVGDAKLHQFGGQMLSDLGGAASVASARMGDAFRRL
jgi:hypothetical protein